MTEENPRWMAEPETSRTPADTAPPCLLRACARHGHELEGYLAQRLGNPDDAADLLQEVWVRALQRGRGFCEVEQPRAWLFRVAHNALVDHVRRRREWLPLPADLVADSGGEVPVVDRLSQCLPRALAALSEPDRLALTLCDLQGGSQQALAARLELSLPGAKSRVQRARQRLRRTLEQNCAIRFDENGHVGGFTCCAVAPGTSGESGEK